LAPVLAHYAIPAPIVHLITGSLGGALGVAHGVGGTLGHSLGVLARSAFVSGLGLAMTAGTAVVATAAVVVLLVLPSRQPTSSTEADEP
jgi:galactitol-specific phosphotransferase system IIC component